MAMEGGGRGGSEIYVAFGFVSFGLMLPSALCRSGLCRRRVYVVWVNVVREMSFGIIPITVLGNSFF